MQTYDSFNTLANANALPLTSDMSTFNSSPSELRNLSKALNRVCSELTQQCVDTNFDEYPDLQEQVHEIIKMLDEAKRNAHKAFLQKM